MKNNHSGLITYWRQQLMVKHIVMFKLKEKNQKNLIQAIDSLNTLRGNIETLKSLEVGTDFLNTERSYDIVLIAIFNDLKGLQTYQDHKIHLPVVKKMRSLCSSSIVVDYEIE
jgi:hypothetical protein